MNALIQFKKASLLFLYAAAIACFGLVSRAQATLGPEIVLPGSPDSCYAGFTTVEGCNALLLVDPANGIGNTAIG
jgi:hypothetical protein